MALRWLRLPALPREALMAVAVAAISALLVAGGVYELGTVGVLVPLAVIAVAVLIARPLLTLTLVVGLTILCEGPTFGLLSFTSHLYVQVYRDISLLDVLVGLVVVSAFLDVRRHRRTLRLPRVLAMVLAILALAMLAGIVTGHESGTSLRYAFFSEDSLAYLLLLPLAVANLDIDPGRIKLLLGGAAALAILKAVLGLVEIAGHLGTTVEAGTTLTYYEPTANWVVMITLLSILVALIVRVKPPLWLLLGSPLMIACLLLSYRRSFWIASVLAVLLVLLFATSSRGRRVLLPAALAIAASIWLLGSIHFQSQLPIVKRLNTLSLSHLEANAEDRYRIDERANVLSEISQHPITGLGMGVLWQATAAPLSVEHEEGREYVHFAALWFWLKLGVLGLCAYIGLIVASLTLAWRAWRSAHEPWLRAFALATMCGVAGLITMDTTASFTGVEPRFTIVLATQIGLLALLLRRGDELPAPVRA